MNARNDQMGKLTSQALRQQELLEQYLTERETNPRAAPPPGLDPQLVQTFLKLQSQVAPGDPDPEFVARLRARLEREAAALASAQSSARAPRPQLAFLPRWSFVGAAAALVIALVALALWATRPAAVSAQELLDKARTAAGNLQSVGVNSFQMTQTSFDYVVDDPHSPPTRTTRGETTTWYAGPTRWRIATHSETTGQPPYDNLTVSDGAAQWDLNPNENTVMVQPADPRSFPFPSVLSLDLLQQDLSNCYDPRMVGEETIAGRAAFKVELGPAKCRSASAPELNGPHTIWLDKETFFVLKSEIRAVNRDQVTSSLVVTAIQYNLELPNELFTFSPPAGARVNDLRPKAAPTAEQFSQQLTAIAQRVAFPVFAPSKLPNGLVPRAPQFNEIENQVVLAYVPPDEASTNTQPGTHGVLVTELLADYELVRSWTDGAEPLELGGAQAWLRRGDYDPTTGLGSNSAALVLRGGTLISVSSFGIAPEQLLEIASSLQPVAGSHAPLPNPTPPALEQIRAQSDFPFRVPTYVPAGLTPAPPTSHQVKYYRADGSLALLVQNAKQGEGGMEQDPRFKGENITLPNGVAAHKLGFEPLIIILWWNQDGGYTSLEGHGISEQEMLKIAASMSPTADLGTTAPPPAQPTPTSVPAPAFAVVRPTWLPEEMSVTERNVPGPSGTGAGVEIRFDPHPNDPPHDVMTLTEYPKELAPIDVNDPQMVKQDIGGREVTIVKRGQGCVSFYWIQGELSLKLTNPYDPPGEPGQVRYSCDDMARLIASIQ